MFVVSKSSKYGGQVNVCLYKQFIIYTNAVGNRKAGRGSIAYQDVFPGIEEPVCVLRSRRDGSEVLKDWPEWRQPVRRERQAPRAEPVQVQLVHC